MTIFANMGYHYTTAQDESFTIMTVVSEEILNYFEIIKGNALYVSIRLPKDMGQAVHFRSNGHNAEISQMTISREMGQLSYLHTDGYTTAMEMTDV